MADSPQTSIEKALGKSILGFVAMVAAFVAVKTIAQNV